jgi:membrane fusion protein (multidrug efflux system)
VVETRRNALLIPQRCVSELQGNFRVFAVTRDGRVELREVQIGPTIGRLQIIESGLEVGERVALEGALLKDGMKVVGKLAELDEAGTAQDTSDQTGA